MWIFGDNSKCQLLSHKILPNRDVIQCHILFNTLL